MVRIAITVEAFDAITSTLPLGSVGYEEWAMIRLFVIGEKLAIDKTERATTSSSWSMAWIKYHDQVA